MPNRYAWIALGVGAYLAFALSLMPAATAYRWFAPSTVRLAGIEGTLWDGRAALGSAAGLPMREVVWNVDALPLLIGRVSARVGARLADGFVETDLRAGLGGIVLQELRASTSLPTLAAVVPLSGVDGLINVTLSRLRLRDGWPTEALGEARIGQLNVVPMMSSTSTMIALGDYEILFDESESGIAARFRDLGGPLEVRGTLQLTSDRRYALEGHAAPRPDAPRELIQGLSFFAGDADASGMRPFSLTGSL